MSLTATGRPKISLAIVGSRTMKDRAKFDSAIASWISVHGEPDEIVTGDATGADRMALAYAKERDIPCTAEIANWSKLGRRAGPERNCRIVKRSTHMLAFLGSGPGTKNSIKQAQKRMLNVTIVQA